ncbi:MAG TPA: cyclic nucleotide-binding domain-containing protein [Candidatus Nitrosotenuis sp.]|jgi:CRP-like cAMP-binding protein|nr:cyclic nucleotide-binding domain-containing protein [Candidatus Nitrosotenuis sp.]
MTEGSLPRPEVGELSRIPFFQHLSPAALEDLARVAVLEEVPAGGLVFPEGAQGDSMYLVLEGEAVVEKQIEPGSPAVKVLGLVFPGQMFGEMAMLEEKPRSAAVRARSDLRLVRISRPEFYRFVQEDPASAARVMISMLTVLSSRLRESARTLVTLFHTSRLLLQARDLEEVGRSTLEQVMLAVPAAEAGALATWNEFTGTCEPLAACGLPDLPSPYPILPDGPLARRLSGRQEALVISADQGRWHELSYFGHRWSLVSPLEQGRELLGFVALFSQAAENPFGVDASLLLATVAAQASAAVVTARGRAEEAARQRLARRYL